MLINNLAIIYLLKNWSIFAITYTCSQTETMLECLDYSMPQEFVITGDILIDEV